MALLSLNGSVKRNSPTEPRAASPTLPRLVQPTSEQNQSPVLRQSGRIDWVGSDFIGLHTATEDVPLVFHWDQQTHFQKHGRNIAPVDLKEEMQVNILYTKEEACLLARAVLVPRRQITIAWQKTPASKVDLRFTCGGRAHRPQEVFSLPLLAL